LQARDKKALLVGINKYHDSKLNDLKFAVNDVSAIYSILTDPNRGGFVPDNCLLMTDGSKNRNLKPVRSNIISLMTSLSETAKPDDYIVFFFSGHGIEEDGKSYLLPSDARINVLRDTAVSIDWIKATLKASKAHTKVLILDACHAGAMKGKAESGRMTKGMQDALFPPMEGFAILSSCKLNEVSWEMPEKKHGVFSYFLIEGLQGAADFDFDGHIFVSDASRYTTERTIDWSFKEGVQQTPNLEYNVVGDLVLVDVPSLERKKVNRKVKKVKQDFSSFDYPISRIRINLGYLSPEERKIRFDQYSAKMCTCLLKYFDLDKIRYVGGRYLFPLGEFDDLCLSLTYNLDSLEVIDKLIVESSQILNPNSICYYCSRLFDNKKITPMIKMTKWVILYYDPKKLLELEATSPSNYFLEVMAKFPEDSQKLRLLFYTLATTKSVAKRSRARIENEKSAILLSPSEKDKHITENLAQIVKPTSFLRIIGDLWES
jgi:hypothetical protein